jgi:transcriptional antiterminator RfaH
MTWYVARTNPRREHQAAASLSRRGVQVYLPILRKKARAGRRDWELLFPGYLFARLEIPSAQWLAARSAPDVAYFLGQPDQPSALPDELVDALTARMERVNRDGGPPRFRPGERVAITGGPFRFLEAVFDRQLSADGRSRVLVQLLQRLVPVELPEDHLERAV